jgi:hypothetical protein
MRVWGAVVVVVGFAAGEFSLSAETAPRPAFAVAPLDLRLRVGAKGRATSRSLRQRGGACELACHGVRPPPARAPLPCAAALLRTCASGPCMIFGSRAHQGPCGSSRFSGAAARACALIAPGLRPVRPATPCDPLRSQGRARRLRTGARQRYRNPTDLSLRAWRHAAPLGRPPAGRQGNHEEQAVCPGNVAPGLERVPLAPHQGELIAQQTPHGESRDTSSARASHVHGAS